MKVEPFNGTSASGLPDSNMDDKMEQGGNSRADEMQLIPGSEQPSIFQLSETVKVDFDEIYKDADENVRNTGIGKVLGGVVIQGCYKPMFYWTQAIFYYILAVPLGAVAAIFWAIVFSIMKLVVNWVTLPIMKLFLIFLSLVAVMVRALIRTACDPVFESVSRAWSGIRGGVQLSVNARLNTTSAVEAGKIYL